MSGVLNAIASGGVKLKSAGSRPPEQGSRPSPGNLQQRLTWLGEIRGSSSVGFCVPQAVARICCQS
jgi:hypothetical protein